MIKTLFLLLLLCAISVTAYADIDQNCYAQCTRQYQGQVDCAQECQQQQAPRVIGPNESGSYQPGQ